MKSFTKFLFALFLLVVFSFLMCPEAYAQKKKKRHQEENIAQQNVQENSGIEGKEDYGNTVSLVTSGTGKTKEDATNNALRSAIEQVFGTFVSSNTQILNDEMIKDEIVSISSGNVVGYEVISSVESNNGYNVSVKSVVSIGKLISYTESHGSSTELAGNTFLRNRDLAILNKNNEKKAITHMLEQIVPIVGRGLFDFSLDVSEPYGTGKEISVDIRVKATPNENMKAFWDIVDHTLSSLNMEENEMKNYNKIGFQTKEIVLAYDKKLGDDCNIDEIFELVWNNVRMRRPYKRICLRNDYFPHLKFTLQLLVVLSRFNFEIYDNLGTLIRPSMSRWDRKSDIYKEKIKHDVSYIQFAGQPADAYFYDFLNNKKDPYLKTKFNSDEKISRIMKNMSIKLYYSASSLSQLKNISIRHAQ